jgi:hypothetical protein
VQKATYIIRERLFGTTELPGRPGKVGPDALRNGEAFFCPICAEVWALILVQGRSTGVRHRACDRHSHSLPSGSSLSSIHTGDLPGSIWLDEDRTVNAAMPPEALSRELTLTLRRASAFWPLPAGVASLALALYDDLSHQKDLQES